MQPTPFRTLPRNELVMTWNSGIQSCTNFDDCFRSYCTLRSRVDVRTIRETALAVHRQAIAVSPPTPGMTPGASLASELKSRSTVGDRRCRLW